MGKFLHDLSVNRWCVSFKIFKYSHDIIVRLNLLYVVTSIMNKPVVINYRQYIKWNILNMLLMTMVWVKYIQISVGEKAWYYLSD